MKLENVKEFMLQNRAGFFHLEKRELGLGQGYKSYTKFCEQDWNSNDWQEIVEEGFNRLQNAIKLYDGADPSRVRFRLYVQSTYNAKESERKGPIDVALPQQEGATPQAQNLPLQGFGFSPLDAYNILAGNLGEIQEERRSLNSHLQTQQQDYFKQISELQTEKHALALERVNFQHEMRMKRDELERERRQFEEEKQQKVIAFGDWSREVKDVIREVKDFIPKKDGLGSQAGPEEPQSEEEIIIDEIAEFLYEQVKEPELLRNIQTTIQEYVRKKVKVETKEENGPR
ncbi:MAG: hypothetical protein MRZ79_04735 [Bacteroidia bacterium]|nr:hypothetical protein [Bacteroidia bacterium]